MIENIRIMLGDSAENYTDAQIELFLRQAKVEVEAYCNRSLDAELEMIAEKIAVIKLNRINTEGLNSQSFSGTNESYVNGYPQEIQLVLNRKRRIKVVS